MTHFNFIGDRKLNIVLIPFSSLPKTHLNIFKVLPCNCFFYHLNISTSTQNKRFLYLVLLLFQAKRKKIDIRSIYKARDLSN